MNRNKKIGAVVLALVLAIGLFYGGMKYGQSKQASFRTGMMGQNGGNFSGGRVGRTNMAGNIISGEILSKDDTSVTIKLKDGGSRIVFIGANTTVSKSVSGSPADLVQGTQVMVVGKPNPDGSANADSVQIRPAAPTK